MRPTGWKHTPQQSMDGSASSVTSGTISEFATSLEAPEHFVIQCDGAKYCLFTFAKENTTPSLTVQFWGTMSNSQAGQTDAFYFNTGLGTATLVGSSTIYFPDHVSHPYDDQYLLDNLLGFTPGGIIEFSEFTFADQDSGKNTQNGSTITSAHYWNRLDHNDTCSGYFGALSGGSEEPARSADSPDAEDSWLYPAELSSSDLRSGPCWVAIPCGMFKYLQLEATSGDDNTFVVFYNLLIP